MVRGSLGQALRELHGAQDIASDYAPLQSLLGIVNMDLNRHDEAEKAFQKALRLDRDNPDIHNNYGWFLCARGNASKGIEWLTKAYTNPLYTTPEKALYNAGKCARKGGDTAMATEYFSKALLVAPRSSAVVYEMASMQFDAEITPRPSNCWIVFTTWIRRHPKVFGWRCGRNNVSGIPWKSKATLKTAA